jgi:hypothetical protein
MAGGRWLVKAKAGGSRTELRGRLENFDGKAAISCHPSRTLNLIAKTLSQLEDRCLVKKMPNEVKRSPPLRMVSTLLWYNNNIKQ